MTTSYKLTPTSLLIYQDALLTPGISPRLANSLKQILHNWKRRIKPALRPHFQQRRIIREGYFALVKLRCAFAIRDFLAINVNYLVSSDLKGKRI